MAGSSKQIDRYLIAISILAGMMLFSHAFAMVARAAKPQTEPENTIDLDQSPGKSEPDSDTDTMMHSSAITGTLNIYYFPFMQSSFPTACGMIVEDTIWTPIDGPYQVVCDVYVEPNATLTIEAGTTVQFLHNSASLYILGELRVEGTEQSPVYFQPKQGETPGSWSGLFFSDRSTGILNYAILEYGGGNPQLSPPGMLNITNSNVQVLHSVVKASAGTGIYIIASSPVISATQFMTNTGETGGGVYIYSGNPLLQNNIFTGNSANEGGGLYINSGNALILNNLFHDNTAEDGGGLYIGAGNAIVRNNIVIHNAANTGGGIFVAEGYPRLDYNDAWNNAGGDYAGAAPGEHDLSTDPLLVDLDNGDFHLTPESPCIDGGDPDHRPPADYEGDIRPMGLAPDIGPDEFRDLGVVKTSTLFEVYPGGPVTYTLQLVNYTTITLTNVQLTDSLPLETAYTEYLAEDFTCVHDGADWGGLLTCALPGASLAPGESRVMTITVALTDTLSWHQSITNTVFLTANGGEEIFASQDRAHIWVHWCRVQLNETPMGDNIQAAIFASTQITDVVKVSGYCYVYGLSVGSTLTLQGGWKWDFTEQDHTVYTTTLDGQRHGVIEVYNETEPIIDGFIITNGYRRDGGGIYTHSGMVKILNNTFIDNEAEYNGGAIYCGWENQLIQNNKFINNKADQGGGLWFGHGSPNVLNNIFQGNEGAGIYNIMGSPLIRDNIFIGNTRSALYNEWGDSTILNNTFIANSGSGGFPGAGITNRGHYPLIQNNTFIDNLGDGLYNDGGNPTIDNNRFVGNSGRGIHSVQGNPIIRNNIIEGNGGGISVGQDSPIIENNLIIGNGHPLTKGGGLSNWNGQPVIQNNVFIANFADLGGAIYNEMNTATIRNNILVDNVANVGGGVYFNAAYPPVLDYNDFRNNTGGDYFGATPGPHDISVNPLLVDPSNGDFHLAPGSPCIDAGDPLNYPPTDFEGDLRPNGVAPDIGADEYYP